MLILTFPSINMEFSFHNVCWRCLCKQHNDQQKMIITGKIYPLLLLQTILISVASLSSANKGTSALGVFCQCRCVEEKICDHNVRDSLSLTSCYLRLSSVQHLLEFTDTVSHARVHVGL